MTQICLDVSHIFRNIKNSSPHGSVQLHYLATHQYDPDSNPSSPGPAYRHTRYPTQPHYSIYQTLAIPTSTMPRCQSKQLLMRGLRPSPQQKFHCAVCTRRCIFCDIWKLASLVYTHISLSNRYSTTPEKLRQYSNQAYDYALAEKSIEAAFSNERVRLASIMSICTVEGADECEGLRMAYSNCLREVIQLLEQEQVLELALVRAPSPDFSQYSYSSRSTHQQSPHSQSRSHYYNDHRRPGLIMA